MKITTIGLDIAKNVFQIHGVDEQGKVVLRKTLKRDKVAEFFAQLPACLIGIEACGSAHHWGRTLSQFGHTVRGQWPASSWRRTARMVRTMATTRKPSAKRWEDPTCGLCRSRAKNSRRS